MRILGYTAVQGVYAFVFIGVLRTIFDIAATCRCLGLAEEREALRKRRVRQCFRLKRPVVPDSHGHVITQTLAAGFEPPGSHQNVQRLGCMHLPCGVCQHGKFMSDATSTYIYIYMF